MPINKDRNSASTNTCRTEALGSHTKGVILAGFFETLTHESIKKPVNGAGYLCVDQNLKKFGKITNDVDFAFRS